VHDDFSGQPVFTPTPPLPQRLFRGRTRMEDEIKFGDSSDEDNEGTADIYDPDDGAVAVDFQSPTKRMKMMDKAALPLPSLPAFHTAATTTPTETLVETATLKQLGMKYNLQYDIAICVECQAGYMFNSFVGHALNGAKRFSIYDPVKQKYVGLTPPQRHSRPALKKVPVGKRGGTTKPKPMKTEEVEKLILKELRALGHNPSPRYSVPMNQDIRSSWEYTATPHPDQEGPIDGLRCFPHGFRCNEGSCADEPFPYCAITMTAMRGHFRDEHPTLSKQGKTVKEVTLQTLCGVQCWLSYFEVRPGGGQGAPRSPITGDISFEDALCLEQKDLYGGFTGDTGLDTDLIDPVYYAAGMVEFWNTFDIAAIRPLQKIVPSRKQNNDLPKDQRLIAWAVLASFLEISLHARTGSAPVLHLVTKGAA
jgi:hypothetical protein